MRQKNWTYLQKCQTRKKKTILLSSPLDGSRSHLSHLMWMLISLSTTEVSEREKSKRALVNVCKCTKKGQARAPSLCANWKMSKVVSNRQGRPPPPPLSSPFACGERNSTRKQQRQQNWNSPEMSARFSLFLSLLEMRWVLLNQTAAIVKLENIFPSREQKLYKFYFFRPLFSVALSRSMTSGFA